MKSGMLWGVMVVLLASGCASDAQKVGEPAGSATVEAMTVVNDDFETMTIGDVPTSWTISRTGQGDGSDWRIHVDPTAPAGSHVVAQRAASPHRIFNLCVSDAARLLDVEVSVAFKAVQGQIDQGGGVVWRYQDENNYYIARFNPLEDNLRCYKVVDGKRIQLVSQEGLSAPSGEWHTLTIQMRGDSIVCRLNDHQPLEVKDSTLNTAGQVGLWTKADAQTYFDRIRVKKLTD